MHFKRTLFYLLIAFIVFQSCRKTYPEISWTYSDKDVIGIPPPKSDQINIDIYLDATTSMVGFAKDNSTIYSQFLDQLEASAFSAWKKADVNYFKFGERVRPINRSEFLLAKSDHDFYHEQGFYLKTYIDSVIKHADSKRLSVVITDLFQDEGDVNTMVERIKEKCFSNNVMVGILGIKSEFNGRVYDVPAYPRGYDLNTKERPFYALIFGNPYNMERLFQSLKVKTFIKENQFLVLSNCIVNSYTLTLTKQKQSLFVNKKAPKENIKNSFDFSMKEKGNEAAFDLSIKIDKKKQCADFSPNDIEAIVYKKSVTDPNQKSSDSTITEDITIENLHSQGGRFIGTVKLKNSDPSGNYSYLVLFKSNQISGLNPPEWIHAFATENPVINTPTASLTYNLDKFTSRLLVANATVSPTYLAKFYLNIYKR